MQWGQMLSQKTTVVGLPSNEARVNVPLPATRFFPEMDGASIPIKVVGSRVSSVFGVSQVVASVT